MGSAVGGSKVFFAFRGHGASTPPIGAWNYAELAADLRRVADAHGATRALGVSMGAGALCRLLADDPGRFERLVFFLPAVLDRPRLAPARERLAELASAVESGSAEVLAGVVAQEVPPAAAGTAAARAYVRQRVAALQGHSAVATALRSLPHLTALDDASALRGVRAPSLVLGCQGDPQHPAEVAERLAELLPSASLHLYDEPGILWTARADLRSRIAGFLNG